MFIDHQKYVLSGIAPLTDKIHQFPLHYIEYEYSAKKEKVLAAACTKHDCLYSIHAILNPLNGSYLLGMNEVIVTPFAEECGQLLAAIEYSDKIVKQHSKSCKEVSDYYAALFGSVDRKQFVTWMFQDIDYWASTFNFQYDKDQTIAIFKKAKQNHTTFLEAANG